MCGWITGHSSGLLCFVSDTASMWIFTLGDADSGEGTSARFSLTLETCRIRSTWL